MGMQPQEPAKNLSTRPTPGGVLKLLVATTRLQKKLILSTRPTPGGVLKLRPTKPLPSDTSKSNFGGCPKFALNFSLKGELSKHLNI